MLSIAFTVPFERVEGFYSEAMIPLCKEDFDPAIFEGCLSNLDLVDRDIFRLYYIEHLSQAVIANIFNLSQGDVSYRLKKRIINKFRTHYFRSKINLDEVYKVFEFNQFEKELLKYFLLFRTQTVISDILGKSQPTLSKNLASIKKRLRTYTGDCVCVEYLKILLSYDTSTYAN